MAGERWPSGALGRVEEGALVGTVEWAGSQAHAYGPLLGATSQAGRGGGMGRVGTTVTYTGLSAL